MKPQKEVKDIDYEKYIKKLFQAFITFGDSYDAERFLKELLTDSEFLMIKRRWHVACLLNEGYNVRQAAEKADVSTQTVEAVKRALQSSQIWLNYLPRQKKAGESSTPPEASDPSRKYIFG